MTSGQIGCPTDEITITDDRNVPSAPRTWTAECRGKTYYYSAHSGGDDTTAQVSCKEASGGSDDGEAGSSAGCSSDKDCKGDRICRDSACVDS